MTLHITTTKASHWTVYKYTFTFDSVEARREFVLRLLGR